MKKNFFKKIRKSAMITILAILAIANVFCVGFSSFLFFGDSVAQSGDVIIKLGDLAQVTPVSVSGPLMTYDGFRETKTSATSLESKIVMKFKLQLAIDNNKNNPISLKIGLKQNNPQALNDSRFNFDMTKIVTSIHVLAEVGGVDAFQGPSGKNVGRTPDKSEALHCFSSFKTYEPNNMSPFGASPKINNVTFDVTCTYNLKFANTYDSAMAFGFVQYNKPNYVLEVLGNA